MSKTVFKLWSIRTKNDFGKAQTYSSKNDLSIVTICEKFTTDVFSNFDTPFSRRKFPGACSSARFDVITAHITVLTELRFIVSLWTINTGRVFAGSEPRVFGNTAHQISPFNTYHSTFSSISSCDCKRSSSSFEGIPAYISSGDCVSFLSGNCIIILVRPVGTSRGISMVNRRLSVISTVCVIVMDSLRRENIT